MRQPHQHFIDRFKERGPSSVSAEDFYADTLRAVNNGNEEFAEVVKTDCKSGVTWYRVRCEGASFYMPMMRGGDGLLFPKTIFSQAEWRSKRAKAKALKKFRSRPHYDPNHGNRVKA